MRKGVERAQEGQAEPVSPVGKDETLRRRS